MTQEHTVEAETIYVKLGGSLITDKTRPFTPREDVIRGLARELSEALDAQPGMRVLLGHGSGSFGHVVGRRYRVREGVHSPEGWLGYAHTAAAAARLNRIVVDIFLEEGLKVVSVPPSASAWCWDGELRHLETRPIRVLLEQGVIPVVYGDVALDEIRGGTIISTEDVFRYLARQPAPLRGRRILLLGEVDGVYTGDPHTDPHARRLPELSPEQALSLETLSGSHGIDVTGGMATKVRIMAELVRDIPGLEVDILSGARPGNLYRALTNPSLLLGTRIRRPDEPA